MSRAIAAGQAAIAAATLHQGTGDIEAWKATFKTMFEGVVFYGQVDQATAPASPAIAQAQANLAAGGVDAAPPRTFKNDDERWRDALIDHPDDWFNNIGDPQAKNAGGTKPDFRYKADTEQVLFLDGKFRQAPNWVFEKLGLPIPGQAAPAPTQGPAQMEAPF